MMLTRSNLDDYYRTQRLARWGRWLLAALLACALSAQADGSTLQSIRPEAIEPALRHYVVQQGPWKADGVEVRALPIANIGVPPGTTRFRVVQAAGALAPGIQNFLIAGENGARETARFWIKGEIRVFDQVVVASAPLKRQEIVTAKDVRLERREIVGRGGRPFARLDDVIGKQVVRAIEANDLVTSGNVDKPLAVKRGGAVTLVFDTGALRVETSGLAEEGGKIGDVIQVKNPASGKIVRGQLLDGRSVRVN